MAELKIFQPEVKKPDGVTEQVALSGTTLFYDNFESFPSVGNESLFYFDRSEKILYSWKEGIGYYSISIGIDTADDRYVNIDGDVMTGTLTVPNLNVDYLDSTDPEVKSIRINKNIVIKNGDVVIGDGGQVHAQGQFTTHADRFLFVEPEDPDQIEKVHHYSLSLPHLGINSSSPTAYLPYEGGHLVTEENIIKQSSYWKIEKYGLGQMNDNEAWWISFIFYDNSKGELGDLSCSLYVMGPSEGWAEYSKINGEILNEKEKRYVVKLDDIDLFTVGAYNFKESLKLGRIKNFKDMEEKTIIRNPIYFKLVAKHGSYVSTEKAYDSHVIKITQNHERQYIEF